jgi:hypothetical protein
MIFDPRPNEHERFKLLSWTCKQLSRVAAVGSSFPSKLGPRFGRGLPGEFRLAGQRFANRAIPRARGTPAVTALVRRGSNLKFIGCRLSASDFKPRWGNRWLSFTVAARSRFYS